jgi:hypothetical protein
MELEFEKLSWKFTWGKWVLILIRGGVDAATSQATVNRGQHGLRFESSSIQDLFLYSFL